MLDRGRRPYRAIRFERKLDAVANDPRGLLEYVRGMARRTSDGLESLVEYDRLDLSVEMLILDEHAPYAPLFTQEDRAAARRKLQRQQQQVHDLAHSRHQRRHETQAQREARIAAVMSDLRNDHAALAALATEASDPELVIAVARLMLRANDRDVAALNRLGRAYQALDELDDARTTFARVLAIDPTNPIATRRLQQLEQTPH